MSMRKTRDLCVSSIRELKDGWRLIVPLSFAYILFLWTQDLIPLLGPAVSSVFTTFLTARLLDRSWKRRQGALIGLGILFFPVNAMWTILVSLHVNSNTPDAMSTSWSVPALFLMCVALTAHALTARRLLDGAENLDKALAAGWKDLAGKFFPLSWIWLLATGLFWICLLSKGYGFIAAAPVALAALKRVTGRDEKAGSLAPGG